MQLGFKGEPEQARADIAILSLNFSLKLNFKEEVVNSKILNEVTGAWHPSPARTIKY